MAMRFYITIPLILLALFPAAASASSVQESVFQDDSALVYSGPAKRDHTLDELKRLGVDTIRTNVIWASQRSLSNWDDLINVATAGGFNVLVTVTGPIPLSASHCHGRARIRRV